MFLGRTFHTSVISPAKIDYNEPSGLRGEDPSKCELLATNERHWTTNEYDSNISNVDLTFGLNSFTLKI